jgi:hypothetical protein
MWLKLNSYFEAVRRPPHLGIRTLIVALKQLHISNLLHCRCESKHDTHCSVCHKERTDLTVNYQSVDMFIQRLYQNQTGMLCALFLLCLCFLSFAFLNVSLHLSCNCNTGFATQLHLCFALQLTQCYLT